MAITFSEATNTITMTGYSEVTPCTFTDLYNADKAGSLSLHARTGIVAVDGAGVAVDRAERPTDCIVLGGASNDLYITIANWNGTVATIQITGTDRDGVAQTEDITVNANGAFYTTKWFKTITSTQVTAFTATSFDYDLTQGQWGKVWKQGTKQFQMDAKLLIGNWSTSSWFQDINKQIVFSDLCYGSGRIIYVAGQANFTLGKLEDEAKKVTSSGCDLRLDVVAYMIGMHSHGNLNLYSTSIYGNGSHYLQTIQRVWNCFTSQKAMIYLGAVDISLLVAFSNSLGLYGTTGPIQNLIVNSCGNGVRYRTDCTVKNGIFTNNTYIAHPYYSDKTINFIDCIVDTWNLSWGTTTGNTVYRKYTFNLKVLDANKNNIENATVVLKDKDDTELFSLTTNASGEVVEQTVTYGYYQQPTGNTIQSASPHTLEIRKAGYKTYKTKFTMDKALDWTICLQKVLNLNFSKRVSIHNY